MGIREAVIILGHRGELIRRALLATPGIGLELRFVENENYLAKNGVSLLAAKDYVDGECLLTMSDHLYSPELPRRLMQTELPVGACGLAVDREVARCFDIDDATKVVTESGRIVEIGKELPDYDCIDTGVFRIGPALIRELEAVVEKHGDASLSEGVRALAARGQFFACDVGDARWIDVDTPEAMARAEAMIRVFGDALGDEPESAGATHPDAVELFAPTWVRAAKSYNEGHFAIADGREDVVRMMSNENPFPPSARVIRAIVEAATNANLYPPNGARLKTKLAARDGLEPHNVLLGLGSTELIDLVIRTFVGPGEEVLLSVPTFSMYEARTRVCGGIPVLVPMTEDHEHDIGGLIRAVTERTKVLFLCTPNNPTGNGIGEADLRRLVRLGLPTVVDEAYVELGDGKSFAHLLREYPNMIVLRTFSKAFGLAGLRLGYAFGHGAVVELLSRVKIPWNVPSITLAAAEAALEDVAEFRARITELKAARAVLSDRLGLLPGLSVLPSDGISCSWTSPRRGFLRRTSWRPFSRKACSSVRSKCITRSGGSFVSRWAHAIRMRDACGRSSARSVGADLRGRQPRWRRRPATPSNGANGRLASLSIACCSVVRRPTVMAFWSAYFQSLKPLSVEEPIDVWVHRPIAYVLARAFMPTPISAERGDSGVDPARCRIRRRVRPRFRPTCRWRGSACFRRPYSIVRTGSSPCAGRRPLMVECWTAPRISSSPPLPLAARPGCCGNATGRFAICAPRAGRRRLDRRHWVVCHTTMYDHYKNVFLRMTTTHREGEDYETALARYRAMPVEESGLVARLAWPVYLFYVKSQRDYVRGFDPFTTPSVSALPAYDETRARIYEKHAGPAMRVWRGWFGFGSLVFGIAARFGTGRARVVHDCPIGRTERGILRIPASRPAARFRSRISRDGRLLCRLSVMPP